MFDLVALQPILNTAIDAVIVMDSHGVIVDWNDRAERVFGWPRQEVLGQRLGDIIVPPRYREAHQHGLTRFLATGHKVALDRLFEISALRRDQSEFPIELSITASGDPTSPIFLGFIRDISERHEAMSKLAVSEARFRAAIDAVQGVIWTNSATGEMQGEQQGWSGLTGQDQAAYEGFGWADAVHPDDADATVEAWNSAVRDRRPFVFEHRVRRHDGVWRDFAVRAVPSLEADGSIREWIGVHTDITEQKLAREQLRESEARFRAMADAAPAPVWMTSAAGGIVFANQAFADLTGLDRAALLGDVWLQLLHPDDMAAVVAGRAAARGKIEAYHFEARFLCDGGVYRWMLASAKPRTDGDGVFQGYIGMAMDLTDIKSAEARQRLLINELNHRVKNTLSSVQSIARQTLRADETPPHVRERLIDRLLAMSVAHDVLTRESWEGASIDEVIRQGMRPFADDNDGTRIQLRGPALRVGPSTALALALAIHELGTNAAKYGALSTLSGTVRITWERTGDLAGLILWQESGGPPVQPPGRRGFGSRLLEGGLSADLGGKPRLDFAVEGVGAVLPVRLA